MTKKLKIIVCLTCWMPFCLGGHLATAAETRLADELYFSGHASLGVVYNDDDDAHYYRELSQRGSGFGELSYEPDTHMGLRLNYGPHKTVGGEVQLITKYGPSGEFQTNLFSALLQVKPGDGWQIRAGLVPLENFYHSDSNHVGYSYLWARPPSEVYNYNIATNFAGLAVHKRFYFNMDSMEVKVFAGKMLNPLSDHMDDQFKAYGSPVFGLTMEYVTTDWSVSFGTSEMDIDERALRTNKNNAYLLNSSEEYVDQALVDLLYDAIVEDNWVAYFFIGGSYSPGNWRFDGTLSQSTSGLLAINHNYMGYLSAGYKIGSLTPYFRVAYSHNNSPTKLAVELPQFIADYIFEAYKDGQSDQTNYALGVRYDFSDHVALKAQYNYIKSEDKPTFLWNYETADWDKDANLFSLVLDVIF